jgi:hypothetical protein
MQHEAVLSAILPVHITHQCFKRRRKSVMLQCFPALVLWMKRILCFTNGLIETKAQPNPSFVHGTASVIFFGHMVSQALQ